MVCLDHIYSAVYGLTDPILGMELGGGRGITVGLLVSMEIIIIEQAFVMIS